MLSSTARISEAWDFAKSEKSFMGYISEIFLVTRLLEATEILQPGVLAALMRPKSVKCTSLRVAIFAREKGYMLRMRTVSLGNKWGWVRLLEGRNR